MTAELKQDVGPPIATPERRTRAKQNVDWLDDKPSLRPVSRKRKRVYPPFRDRFVSSLGHHRLVAAQGLYGELGHMDIIIQELTDEEMLRMMANEKSLRLD